MQSSQREVEGVVSRLDALQVFFKPRSVAVIGASRREGSVGNEIVRNLIECGYPGKIYPINPKAEEIRGIPCYRSVLKVKDEIDLGVIAVPAPIVPKVAEEAGRKGVKCLIVISAGFKEAGAEGARLEEALVGRAADLGLEGIPRPPERERDQWEREAAQMVPRRLYRGPMEKRFVTKGLSE